MATPPLRAVLLLTAVTVLLPQPAFALPSCGDGNGNGSVASSDALLTLKKAVAQPVSCPPCACDTNADHSVTAADALAILKRAVGSQRYLSCFHQSECSSPLPKLDGLLEEENEPARVADAAGTSFAADKPTWIRFFGGSLNVEVPAVYLASNRAWAATPPLAAGVLQPMQGFRVQLLQDTGSQLLASNATEGIAIEAAPLSPAAPGTMTADFLGHMVTRANELLGELPAGDMAAAVAETRDAMQALRALVLSLRDHASDEVSLGTLHGSPLLLDRNDLVQVDSMLLATLLAQSDLPSSPATSATSGPSIARAATSRGEGASAQVPDSLGARDLTSDCRQGDALAYYNSAIANGSTQQTGLSYATSTCIASASKTSFAVTLAPAALASGVLSLTAGAAAGVALAQSAAATLYVSIVGSGGLAAVGSALEDTSQDAVALVKQGVALAESTMEGLIGNVVLPGASGAIKEMIGAAKDLYEAFQSFEPSPTTTIGSTTTTLPGNDCWCCCAYWDGVSNPFYCIESAEPQQPTNGEEAVCNYYSEFSGLCGTGFCEGG